MTTVHDFPIVVANMPATARQRAVALIVIFILLIIALIAAPFAEMQLLRVNAFIPVLQTVLCLAAGSIAPLVLAYAPRGRPRARASARRVRRRCGSASAR